jgi:hypothetical protein
MNQSAYWKLTGTRLYKKFLVLWKVHYWHLTSFWRNLFHFLSSHAIFNLCFNVMASSTATSCKLWFVSFRFSNRDYVCMSHLHLYDIRTSPRFIASSKFCYVCDKNRWSLNEVLALTLFSDEIWTIYRVSENECTHMQRQKSMIFIWQRNWQNFKYETSSIERTWICTCVSFRAFEYRMDFMRAAEGAQVEVQWNGERWGEKLSA